MNIEKKRKAYLLSQDFFVWEVSWSRDATASSPAADQPQFVNSTHLFP
jgi:hypothetical protein